MDTGAVYSKSFWFFSQNVHFFLKQRRPYPRLHRIQNDGKYFVMDEIASENGLCKESENRINAFMKPLHGNL